MSRKDRFVIVSISSSVRGRDHRRTALKFLCLQKFCVNRPTVLIATVLSFEIDLLLPSRWMSSMDFLWSEKVHGPLKGLGTLACETLADVNDRVGQCWLECDFGSRACSVQCFADATH